MVGGGESLLLETPVDGTIQIIGSVKFYNVALVSLDRTCAVCKRRRLSWETKSEL